MRIFITGCAGFIGSNLVDRLLSEGHEVIGYDNFSTGRRKFLENALSNKNFTLNEGDLLDSKKLNNCVKEVDTVFHFAANADVRFGLDHPKKDLENNTIATFNLLEAMRHNGCKSIAFSSTGSVYGEAKVIPTPEDAPFPIQTSLYGASKLAGESLISYYCEGYGFHGRVFRFVSILGDRYTHGHVYDFYRQLMQDPKNLVVLGDGKQKKSYLHVQDCIDAVTQITFSELGSPGFEIFNLGVDDYCEVLDSVSWICQRMGVSPKIETTGGRQGWIGDNPFIQLDTNKAQTTGWKPKYSIKEGVISTVDFLAKNKWVF